MKRGAKATQPTPELGAKLGDAVLVAADAVPAQRMARTRVSFVMNLATSNHLEVRRLRLRDSIAE